MAFLNSALSSLPTATHSLVCALCTVPEKEHVSNISICSLSSMPKSFWHPPFLRFLWGGCIKFVKNCIATLLPVLCEIS